MSEHLITVSKYAGGSACAICRQHSAFYLLETSITISTFGFSGTHQVKAPFCMTCKQQLLDGLSHVDDAPGAPVPAS